MKSHYQFFWRRLRRVEIMLEFKLQDVWIGAFWNFPNEYETRDLWLCLVPCFPIHFRWSSTE